MRDSIAAQQFPHIEAFRAGIQSICGAYHVEPGSRSFAARAGLATRGGLELASLALTSASVTRDARAFERDGMDHFVLTMQRRGQTKMVQNDQNVLLRQGDMFLSDATRASYFDFSYGAAEQLSVHLPRAAVLDRFGTDARGGHCIRREDSLAVAMTALLQRAQDDQPPAIGEAFLALLGAWLEDRSRGAATHSAQGDSLLGRALTLIDLHYRDFGPCKLAELLDVAPRRLQRAFATLEETPRDRILATRLDQARRALAQRGSRTVLDVAYEQGFGDLSHFYHAFKARFGEVPGTIRTPSPCDA
jgi:AraC family transcriptional regulator, positive regulator of tynA and feaB